MRLDKVVLDQKDSMESTDVEEKMWALAEFNPSGTVDTQKPGSVYWKHRITTTSSHQTYWFDPKVLPENPTKQTKIENKCDESSRKTGNCMLQIDK